MIKTYSPTEFTTMLREARERAGMSQNKAAAATTPSISASTWWAYEHGRKHPTFAMAAKLAAAVGVTLKMQADQP